MLRRTQQPRRNEPTLRGSFMRVSCQVYRPAGERPAHDRSSRQKDSGVYGTLLPTLQAHRLLRRSRAAPDEPVGDRLETGVSPGDAKSPDARGSARKRRPLLSERALPVSSLGARARAGLTTPSPPLSVAPPAGAPPDHLYFDPHDPCAEHLQTRGRLAAQIDDPPAGVRAPIVDPHGDRPVGVLAGYPDHGAEGELFVGRRHGVHVVAFAGCGGASVVTAAVPARLSVLHEPLFAPAASPAR
jgi:hypothetical protein